VLGRAELDTLLSERERLNEELQRIIDEQTEPWGIKVTTVEIKDVEIPQTMQRAMARQAEAERERRAKIIAAEGEFQAADKLAQAAATIGREPTAIQLRFLQTLVEVASERNSTTIFPVPIDLFRPFIEAAQREQAERASGPPQS
jgi:regulator of protease activity HflC (stomatin/prohibitin superfamily)